LSRLKHLAIILIVLAATCANVHAQTITINVRNTSVKKILDSILSTAKDRKYIVHFENDKIGSYLKERINFKAEKLSFHAALDSLFFSFPITYIIDQHLIVLNYDPTPKERIIHKITISGRVINQRQEALKGATVYVNNKKRGISTNDNGYFEMQVESLPVPITVSYVGHQPLNTQITDSITSTLLLTEVIEELETMINTGYVRQAKDRFTGKLSSLTANEIATNANPDIMQNIAMQIPAMIQHFNNDFTNNIPQYQIRGRTTIHANPNPLIILDQIPYQSNTFNIHPDDIARVDVLKDAAAAAIWGARSGNGVIVFTTKEGKVNNKARITASVTSGIARKKNLFAEDYLSSSEIIDLELRLFDQKYYDRFYNRPNFPILSPVAELKYAESKGLISSTEVNRKIEDFRNQDIRNNIKDHFQRNAGFTQANAQIIGGGNQNTYFFSIGGLKQLHETPGKESNRLTVNTKNRFLPFNGVELGNHILYTEWRHDLPHDPTQNLDKFIQYAPWVDAEGNALPVAMDYRQSFKDSMTEQSGYRNWNYYPLTEHQNNFGKKYQNELLFQLNAKFKVKKRLHFDFIYNFNFSRQQDVNRFREESYEYRHTYNKFSWVENGELKSIIPRGEMRHEGITDEKTQTYRYTATYHFGVPKWSLKSMIIIGGETRKREIGYTNEFRFGYNSKNKSSVYIDLDPLYPILNKTASSIIKQNIRNFNVNENYYSEFLLLTNQWKDKIIIETNLRRDASNLFGVNTNNKFIPLWSIGSKFNLEELTKNRFFKNTSINVNFGKTGNIDHNTTSLLQVMKQTTAQGATPILQVLKPNDPNLKWETSDNLNISFNRYFEKLNINASIDYYENNSKDLIINKMIDPILGVDNAWVNDGRLLSKGLEVFVSHEANLSNKVKWYNQLSFNYNRSVIKRYGAMPEYKMDILRKPIINLPGKELYSIYANNWNGIDVTTGQPVFPQEYSSFESYLKELNLDNTTRVGNLLPKYLIRWMSRINLTPSLIIGMNMSYRSQLNVLSNQNSFNNAISSYIGYQSPLLAEITGNVSDQQLITSLGLDNVHYLMYSNQAYLNSSVMSIEHFYINYRIKKFNNLSVTLSTNNLLNLSNKRTQEMINNFFRRSFNVNFKFTL
jgi:TonB-dependent SusC/RagA subfamily outer membrane receptor